MTPNAVEGPLLVTVTAQPNDSPAVAVAADGTWVSVRSASAPTAEVAARTRGSQSSGATTTPLSPWIGSRTTAATLSSTAASSAATSS